MILFFNFICRSIKLSVKIQTFITIIWLKLGLRDHERDKL